MDGYLYVRGTPAAISPASDAAVHVHPSHPDERVKINIGEGLDAATLYLTRKQLVDLIEQAAPVVGYRVREIDEQPVRAQ